MIKKYTFLIRLYVCNIILIAPIVLHPAQAQTNQIITFYEQSKDLIQKVYNNQQEQVSQINTLPFVNIFYNITGKRVVPAKIDSNQEFTRPIDSQIKKILSEQQQFYKKSVTAENKNDTVEKTSNQIFEFLLKHSISNVSDNQKLSQNAATLSSNAYQQPTETASLHGPSDSSSDDSDEEQLISPQKQSENEKLFITRAQPFIQWIIDNKEPIETNLINNIIGILCSFSLHIMIDPITKDPQIGCLTNKLTTEKTKIIEICEQNPQRSIQQIAQDIFNQLQKTYSFQQNKEQESEKIIIQSYLYNIYQTLIINFNFTTEPLSLFQKEKTFYAQTKKYLEILKKEEQKYTKAIEETTEKNKMIISLANSQASASYSNISRKREIQDVLQEQSSFLASLPQFQQLNYGIKELDDSYNNLQKDLATNPYFNIVQTYARIYYKYFKALNNETNQAIHNNLKNIFTLIKKPNKETTTMFEEAINLYNQINTDLSSKLKTNIETLTQNYAKLQESYNNQYSSDRNPEQEPLNLSDNDDIQYINDLIQQNKPALLPNITADMINNTIRNIEEQLTHVISLKSKLSDLQNKIIDEKNKIITYIKRLKDLNNQWQNVDSNIRYFHQIQDRADFYNSINTLFFGLSKNIQDAHNQSTATLQIINKLFKEYLLQKQSFYHNNKDEHNPNLFKNLIKEAETFKKDEVSIIQNWQIITRSWHELKETKEQFETLLETEQNNYHQFEKIYDTQQATQIIDVQNLPTLQDKDIDRETLKMQIKSLQTELHENKYVTDQLDQQNQRLLTDLTHIEATTQTLSELLQKQEETLRKEESHERLSLEQTEQEQRATLENYFKDLKKLQEQSEKNQTIAPTHLLQKIQTAIELNNNYPFSDDLRDHLASLFSETLTNVLKKDDRGFTYMQKENSVTDPIMNQWLDQWEKLMEDLSVIRTTLDTNNSILFNKETDIQTNQIMKDIENLLQTVSNLQTSSNQETAENLISKISQLFEMIIPKVQHLQQNIDSQANPVSEKEIELRQKITELEEQKKSLIEQHGQDITTIQQQAKQTDQEYQAEKISKDKQIESLNRQNISNQKTLEVLERTKKLNQNLYESDLNDLKKQQQNQLLHMIMQQEQEARSSVAQTEQEQLETLQKHFENIKNLQKDKDSAQSAAQEKMNRMTIEQEQALEAVKLELAAQELAFKSRLEQIKQEAEQKAAQTAQEAQRTLEQKNATVTELQQKLNQAQQADATKQAEHEQALTNLDDRATQKIKEEQKRVAAIITDLEQQLARQQEEQRRAQYAMQATQDQAYAEYTQQLRTLEDAKNQDIDRIQQELKKAQKDAQATEATLRDALTKQTQAHQAQQADAIARTDAITQQAQEKNRQNQAKIVELQVRLEAAQREQEQAHQTLDTLQREYQAKVSGLEEQLNTQNLAARDAQQKNQDTIKQLKQNLAAMQKKAKERKASAKTALQKKEAELQKAFKEKKITKQQFDQELKTAQQNAQNIDAQAKQDIDTLSTQLTEAQQQAYLLEQTLAQTQKEKADIESAAQEKMNRMTIEQEQAHTNMHNLSNQLNNAANLIENLENSLKTSLEETDTIRNQLAQAQQDKENAEQIMRDLINQIDAIRQEQKVINQNLRNKEQELTQALTNNQITQQEFNTQLHNQQEHFAYLSAQKESESQRLSQQLQQSQQQAQRADQERALLAQQLHNAQNTVFVQKAELLNSKKIQEEERLRHNQEVTHLQQQLQDQQNRYNAEIQDIRNTAQDAIHQAQQDAQRQQQTAQQQAEARIRAIQGQLEQAQQDAQRQQAKNNQTNDAALQEQRRQAEESITRLQNELAQAEQDKVRVAQEAQETLNQAIATARAQQQQDLNSMRNHNQTEIDSLTRQLRQAQQDAERYQQNLEQALNTQQQNSTQNAQLRQQLSQALMDAQQQNLTSQAQITNLQAQLHAVLEEKRQIENEMQRIQNEQAQQTAKRPAATSIEIQTERQLTEQEQRELLLPAFELAIIVNNSQKNMLLQSLELACML